MKELLKILLFMAVIGLVIGCNTADDMEFDNAALSKGNSKKMVTLGFNIVFTGTYNYQGPDATLCDGANLVRVNNTGEGTGTHFKKLFSYFDFCVDVTDSTYPNGYVDAYFTDENGDILYVTVAGQVLGGRAPGMPAYALSYFKDPFIIIGGTGRFENAEGSGFTNDYNFMAKDGLVHTRHHWKGKIKMKKGK